MSDWFITWDRPEYKEWAMAVSGGYALLVFRPGKEQLCVRAKLVMPADGLPEFKVIEERRVPSEKEATSLLKQWKAQPLP